MHRDFPEADWRFFRKVSRSALDRYCARVLAEIAAVSTDASKTNHERYGEVYRLMRERDRELALAFDGASRSKASHQLFLMFELGLITEDELSRFSTATQEYVRSWLR